MNGYIAQIMWFAGDFAPKGWAFCAGQTLAISQNSALFSLIGNTFGGDGRTTFMLPNFKDRCAIGAGQGAGLPAYVLGKADGTNTVTLTPANLPPHTHPVTFGNGASNSAANTEEGPGSVLGNANIYAAGAAGNLANIPAQPSGVTGAGQAFSIQQPYLGMNFVICLSGFFPPRP